MSSYSHTFTWHDASALKVFATGDFDNWNSTLKLSRGSDGTFSATTDLPTAKKTLFKYVVDGQWVINPNQPHETDSNGNENNVIQAQVTAPVIEEPTSAPLVPEVAPLPHVEPISISTDSVTELAPTVEHPTSPLDGITAAAAAIAAAGVVAAAAVISVDPAVLKPASPEPAATATTPTPIVASETLSESTATPEVPQPTELERVPVLPTSDAPTPTTASESPAVPAIIEAGKKSEIPIVAAAAATLAAVIGGAATLGHTATSKVAELTPVAPPLATETVTKAQNLTQSVTDSATKSIKVATSSVGATATKGVETVDAVSSNGDFGTSAMAALGLKEEAIVSSPVVASPVPVISTPPTINSIEKKDHLAPIIPLQPLNDAEMNTTIQEPIPAVVAATIPLPTPTSETPLATPREEMTPVIPVKDEISPATIGKGTLGKKSLKGLKNGTGESESGVGGVPRVRKPSLFRRLFPKKD